MNKMNASVEVNEEKIMTLEEGWMIEIEKTIEDMIMTMTTTMIMIMNGTINEVELAEETQICPMMTMIVMMEVEYAVTMMMCIIVIVLNCRCLRIISRMIMI